MTSFHADRPAFGGAATSPARSRAQSVSSDRPSLTGHGLTSTPLFVSPPAAFIAASAASQIVTKDHEMHADTWYDQQGLDAPVDVALVSAPAMQLVNSFLDHLLFSFLNVSCATTLSTLRPAVSDILRPKLAHDVIMIADEELREYLGGADEDDFVCPLGADPSRDWDVELVWKRSRLRCMVYSSLGDMEEEEEDYHAEHENLDVPDHRSSNEVISPAVAIFLTSILEIMAEQVLVVAGQAALLRSRSAIERDLREGHKHPGDVAPRIVVDELDMERVALDRTLGRLWRAWKKRLRSPTAAAAIEPASYRPYSPDSIPNVGQALTTDAQIFPAALHPLALALPLPSIHRAKLASLADLARRQSHDVDADARLDADADTHTPVKSDAAGATTTTTLDPGADLGVLQFATVDPVDPVDPASIALPTHNSDVYEIEHPGLARDSDDDADDPTRKQWQEKERRSQLWRPKSLHQFMPSHTSITPARLSERPLSNPIQPTPRRAKSLPPDPYSRLISLSHPCTRSPDDDQSLSGRLPDQDSDTLRSLEGDGDPSDSSVPLRPLSLSPSINDFVDTSEVRLRSSLTIPPSPQLDRDHSSDRAGNGPAADMEEEEDDAEEPQILVSERIPLSPIPSSFTEFSTAQPIKRSPSVHSARMIDVARPRSSTASRSSSAASRPSSVASRPSSAVSRERARSVSSLPPSPTQLSPVAALSAAQSDTGDQKQPRLDLALRRPAAAHLSIRLTPVGSPRNQPISEADEETYLGNSVERLDDNQAITSTPTAFPMVPEARSWHKLPSPHQPLSPPPGERHWPSNPNADATGMARCEAVLMSPSSRSPGPVRPERLLASRNGLPSPQSPTFSLGQHPVDRHGRFDYADGHDIPLVAPSTSITPRPIHTSGSSASSSTGRLKLVRNSEESGRHRNENVVRNFEELIHSDETIQYTLTPEGMRDVDDSLRSVHNSSPVVTAKSRKSDDSRIYNGSRSRSSSNSELHTPQSPVHFPRLTGFGSHPILNDFKGRLGSAAPHGPGRQPDQGKFAIKARDARAPRESVMDIAEFIRTTGPPPLGDHSSAPARKFHPPAPSSTYVLDSNLPSIPSSRKRLQARDATVDFKEDNSDLIDFIRRGPPSGSNNPRISRSVAPFRTTMDSDQMVGAVGGRAVDATLPNIRYSQATNTTDVSMPSMTSSINSQSALLKNKGPPYHSVNGSTMADEEDSGMSKRKTRRVADPYAVEFSDDDEIDYQKWNPKPIAAKEETMAEFLSNYDPPSESGPHHMQQQQQPPATPRKKLSSSSSLIGRFSRNSAGTTAKQPRVPAARVPPPRRHQHASPLPPPPPPNGARAAHGAHHASGDSPARVPSLPSPPSFSPVQRRYEPRSAVSATPRMGDIADFLRNSEPPPQSDPAAYSPQSAENGGSFSRIFTRRKKSMVYV